MDGATPGGAIGTNAPQATPADVALVANDAYGADGAVGGAIGTNEPFATPADVALVAAEAVTTGICCWFTVNEAIC